MLAPGRAQPPSTVAFVVGYLSHIGLDTWAENYLSPDFPAAARQGLPAAWYPPAVLDRAVKLRRQQKMKLGDSLVAGTALAHSCTWVTRNI